VTTSRQDYNEEELARLISVLPPAPEAWEMEAKDLPLARRAIDQILTRAAADEEFRMTTLDHPEDALRDAGCEPAPTLVSALRSRLTRKAMSDSG
jgi:hypothetical protein